MSSDFLHARRGSGLAERRFEPFFHALANQLIVVVRRDDCQLADILFADCSPERYGWEPEGWNYMWDLLI